MAGHPPLTKDEFDLIRELVELNIPMRTIERLSGRSDKTVARVKRYATWDEYCGRDRKSSVEPGLYKLLSDFKNDLEVILERMRLEVTNGE